MTHILHNHLDQLVRYDVETMPAMDGVSLPAAPMHQAGEMVDNRYRILAELGHGGMGVVYLAEDSRLQRRVAIKFLRAQATEIDVTRFRREAQLLASLSHPNVVKVYDLGEREERPYFVMEYLAGETLVEMLHHAGGDGLPVDVALGFGRQLCEALDAVHRQGIIHRDIKPGNVIITAGMNAVLMDFGLARREVTAKERGTVSGTPQYLSPEDIRGVALQGDDARRSDIYALGITLYELIAGRPPFSDDNTAVVLHHQLHDRPSPLCEIRPDVPAAFEAVIMRALEKDPFARQASCGELVVELALARQQVVANLDLALPPARITTELGPPMADLNPVLLPTGAPSQHGPTTHSQVRRPSTGTSRSPVVALVLNGGPLRDSLADGVRAALPGCEVSVLPRGSLPVREALTQLRPRCVVLDMELLEDSPFELCAALRSQPATANSAIVLLGEGLAPEQEALLTRMGVTAILRKPIDVARLARQIQQSLAS